MIDTYYHTSTQFSPNDSTNDHHPPWNAFLRHEIASSPSRPPPGKLHRARTRGYASSTSSATKQQSVDRPQRSSPGSIALPPFPLHCQVSLQKLMEVSKMFKLLKIW
ncbi:uncharacterized protein [Triticum aestivum]|uniref:uncharacterized protein n=1 Tax=Triticum aestivum TaxID=4565 RepID=UPI001D002715|nr:uncharacterized protein LOC123063499 [Triticum aestivum]